LGPCRAYIRRIGESELSSPLMPGFTLSYTANMFRGLNLAVVKPTTVQVTKLPL
jgi:hypothetical protein